MPLSSRRRSLTVRPDQRLVAPIRWNPSLTGENAGNRNRLRPSDTERSTHGLEFLSDGAGVSRRGARLRRGEPAGKHSYQGVEPRSGVERGPDPLAPHRPPAGLGGAELAEGIRRYGLGTD